MPWITELKRGGTNASCGKGQRAVVPASALVEQVTTDQYMPSTMPMKSMPRKTYAGSGGTVRMVKK